MDQNTNRIQSLCHAFVALLDQETKASGELLAGLDRAVRALQEETRDARLARMLEQIRKLRERSHLFSEMAKRDFVDRISEEAREFKDQQIGARLGRVIIHLIRSGAALTSSKGFFAVLLDGLIAETGAKRGFLLLYLPESTEAEVISARHFQTTHLSASEYGLSRTVVRQVLEQGRAVVLDDATQDPRFATAASIRELKLLSILAVPLKENERTIGAIYLDHQTLSAHFGAGEQQLVEDVANFAVFYLRHSRLLPLCRKEKSSVFLDAARAPRELIGNHPKILEVLDVVRRVADKPATVLIEGESGTGKELVARALHYESCRADHPLWPLIALPYPEIYWSLSSLDTKRELLLEQLVDFLARFRRLTKERSFLTKSASWTIGFRRSSCAFCNSVNSGDSAIKKPRRSMCVWLPQPARTFLN